MSEDSCSVLFALIHIGLIFDIEKYLESLRFLNAPLLTNRNYALSFTHS